MRERYLVIRALEAFIAIMTTYIALQSFFSSSIYEFISNMTKLVFEEMGVILKTNLNSSRYMPIILTLVVLIAIAYEFILGEEINIINIYQINFMLFLPEALSFSRINWFNLLDAGYILRPLRGYYQVFISGVIIMSGYSILAFTAQYRSNMREYLKKGIDIDQLKEVLANQTILSFLLGLFSAVLILIVSLIVPVIKNLLLDYASLAPYPYLILGVSASIVIFFWLILMIRNNVLKSVA
ncbi:hypothetical protein GF319_03280 [Candidatus Bathyarchaeota archaeon]|nr:hypothetical protein [Candidatus Bathyarchaeota archaeon]